MPLVLPNTISNGTIADASNVQENFDALRNFTNGVEADLAEEVADRIAAILATATYTDDEVADSLTGHRAASGAHAASKISFAATGSVSSSNVQSAVAEVAVDALNGRNALNTRVSALESKSWSNLGLSNSWVDFSGRQDAEYRKIGDVVELRGQIRNGTFTNGTLIATLGSGFRPKANDIYPLAAANNDAGYFYVTTTGRIEVYDLGSNAGVGLSGIRFSTS